MDWHSIFQVLKYIFYIAYVFSAIGVGFMILLDNREPLKTITWVLVLFYLPVLGLILYIFFGQSTRHLRIISKKVYKDILKTPKSEFIEPKKEMNERYKNMSAFFLKTNYSFIHENNDVETYTNGYDMLQNLMKILYNAKSYIHMEYYIIMDDAVGNMIKDVLIDKAKQGVEIRFLYDDVGCWKVDNEFFEEMKDNGIDARAFLKVRFPLFTSKVNYRNHRKIVVVDGVVGMVGGINLAERYIKGINGGVWRDTHWKLKGNIVHGLQRVFLLDWYFVDQTLLDQSYFFPLSEEEGDKTMQVVSSMPSELQHEMMQGLILALSNARDYFYLQTPYFLPTPSVLLALQSAALRGVDVRLMLPEKSDGKLVRLATYSYIKVLLESGIKVYMYQKGFLHSKMMVSDDYMSTVGTTNLDFRSFVHNFEVNAFAYDITLALEIKRIFLQDQKDSIRLYLKEWEKRSSRQKLSESICRLFAPLL